MATRYGNYITRWATVMLAVLVMEASLHAQSITPQLQHIVDTTFAAHPAATGIMVSTITADGKVWNYAVGVSDKVAQSKLKANQPVLLASITKTYISATILRLCEQKKLDITDSIGAYLPVNTVRKLTAAGYKTPEITVAHLLSHTSGINDFVDHDYHDFVNTHKQYRWTRDEQIDRAMKTGKPLGQPGDTFRYADVNYLLLTQIIESITHKPFYTAVRQLLNYRGLELNATWFASLERKPYGAAVQAHQYWNKYPWDTYEMDPSWDLFGGGGIVAPPGDVALFFKSLFEGKIIKDKSILAKMYTRVPGKAVTNYCLGLRKLTLAGLTGYYHGGFLGTDAIYFPDLKTAICIVVLEKEEQYVSANICNAIAGVIKQSIAK